MRFAIVVSDFNKEICDGLLAGAKAYLEEKNISLPAEDIFYAPGAFEIPLFAKKIAAFKKYDGIIGLGCVIKGETAHFEYISSAAALGIQMASLETGLPISFGVLTTYNQNDAKARSIPGENNKGREAARACVKSVLAFHEKK